MYGRCSNLSALLPRIWRFLFQFRNLCDRNFGNGLSWTTGLVTYLGGRNIISLSQCSLTPPRLLDQPWIKGDINALEPRALCNTLISFFPSIRNARSDVWTNNVTFPEAWENGGCRSHLVKKGFKNIEEMYRAENFALLIWHWLFLVRGDVGPSFKRGLDHGRLTWCLWTATVAEEGIETSCLITLLSRLRILQESMFSHKWYRWNIASMSFLLTLWWNLCCGAFLINASVSVLPPLSLVYNAIVIGGQYSKLWQ